MKTESSAVHPYDETQQNLGIITLGQTKEDMEEKKQKWGVSSDTINEINKGIEPMNTSRNIDTERSGAEGIRRNLKPFSLELAKQGKPVCTRDGRKARIICFDAILGSENSLIVLINNGSYESLEVYKIDGRYYLENLREYDLMMLLEKKEGWVNVYHDNEGNIYTDEYVFNTEKDAIVFHPHNENRKATVKIEWYE